MGVVGSLCGYPSSHVQSVDDEILRRAQDVYYPPGAFSAQERAAQGHYGSRLQQSSTSLGPATYSGGPQNAGRQGQSYSLVSPSATSSVPGGSSGAARVDIASRGPKDHGVGGGTPQSANYGDVNPSVGGNTVAAGASNNYGAGASPTQAGQYAPTAAAGATDLHGTGPSQPQAGQHNTTENAPTQSYRAGDTAASSDVEPSRKQLFVRIQQENYDMYKTNKFGRPQQTLVFKHDRCEAELTKLKGNRLGANPTGEAEHSALNVPAPKVVFSGKSTADVLLEYGKRKHVVCGLNFANGITPGGGYKHGSVAQEEDLCRRMPTLYTALFKAQKDNVNPLYPFGPSTYNATSPTATHKYSDVLYTKDLVVARSGEDAQFQLLAQHEHVKVSIVTAAAPNKSKGELVDERLLMAAVKNIFVAPLVHQPEVTTLVLGAWGCGAFGGDPVLMSELFARAITTEGLGGLYQEIHFAIPPSGKLNQLQDNPHVFMDTFKRHGIQVSNW